MLKPSETKQKKKAKQKKQLKNNNQQKYKTKIKYNNINIKRLIFTMSSVLE